ncbi:hypothetical protein MPER_01950 [Moniliophthora perniciosa FA553]|nr:hypothetical protein MPER_01950 [Moniliophthora perniciosa FA553]
MLKGRVIQNRNVSGLRNPGNQAIFACTHKGWVRYVITVHIQKRDPSSAAPVLTKYDLMTNEYNVLRSSLGKLSLEMKDAKPDLPLKKSPFAPALPPLPQPNNIQERINAARRAAQELAGNQGTQTQGTVDRTASKGRQQETNPSRASHPRDQNQTQSSDNKLYVDTQAPFIGLYEDIFVEFQHNTKI